MTAITQSISPTSSSRRLFLRLAAGAAVVPWLSCVAHAASRVGEVAELRGRAEALTGEQRRMLAKMADIFVNDLVRTEAQSRLSLQLGKSTLLKLGAESEIRIDKYLPDAGGEIELVNGVIGFARVGQKADDDLRVRSAYGLIAVRGTRFYAGPSEGRFGVLVDEGRVEVSAAGKTVVLGPQQGTDFAAPGAPPSPPARWKAARTRALVALVR